jgi:hypothetical protein
MIFFLRSASSIIYTLEVRKMNAQWWALLFRAFICEPFVARMARMATAGICGCTTS